MTGRFQHPATLAPIDTGPLLFTDMPRTKGAISRDHLRIRDPELFAVVIGAMARAATDRDRETLEQDGERQRRGRRGDGVNALARRARLSPRLIGEWLKGERVGISRETFATLEAHTGVELALEVDVAVAWSEGLVSSLVAEDGGSLWPSPQPPPRRVRLESPVVTLKHAIASELGAVAADRVLSHLRSGVLSKIAPNQWAVWPLERPVLLTRAEFAACCPDDLSKVELWRVGLTAGYEGNDGSPAVVQDDEGPRYQVWFSSALSGLTSEEWRRAMIALQRQYAKR